MKVAFSILNMPDGGWHWVARVWKDGVEQACTIYSATTRLASAPRAFAAALELYEKIEKGAELAMVQR